MIHNLLNLLYIIYQSHVTSMSQKDPERTVSYCGTMAVHGLSCSLSWSALSCHLACSSSAASARSKEALLWTWKPQETGGNTAVNGQSWVISHVPIFHITQPLGINGLLDGYYKVMSNIPKMGHLPTPDSTWTIHGQIGSTQKLTTSGTCSNWHVEIRGLIVSMLDLERNNSSGMSQKRFKTRPF